MMLMRANLMLILADLRAIFALADWRLNWANLKL